MAIDDQRPLGGDHPAEDWRALNRASWDERVGIHVVSDFYDNPGFRRGRSSLRPFEIDEVGPVEGRSLVHLQCHFGQDTLSWARLGAHVTGLDFSPAAIEAATTLAAEIGIDADFVVADVYDAVEALGRRQFDVVYTGLGALIWLPDIERWADVVASLVAPGGFVYLAEFHPITEVFADESLTVEHDYFTRPAGTRYEVGGTYTDGDVETTHNVSYEWTHPVSAVITALLAQGLQLELFHEHDHTLWARWPFLDAADDGTYRQPAGQPRLPLMYSLRARKPLDAG